MSLTLTCGECGGDYEADMDTTDCPHCGFGPEDCSHPQGDRTSDTIYSVDEGQHVERLLCGKCGEPV